MVIALTSKNIWRVSNMRNDRQLRTMDERGGKWEVELCYLGRGKLKGTRLSERWLAQKVKFTCNVAQWKLCLDMNCLWMAKCLTSFGLTRCKDDISVFFFFFLCCYETCSICRTSYKNSTFVRTAMTIENEQTNVWIYGDGLLTGVMHWLCN